MSSYLIKVTEQYRCDTEQEAKTLIDEAKQNHQYTVIKSLKQKGEIVDEWRRVIITKENTSEKEPDSTIMPNYEEEEGI